MQDSLYDMWNNPDLVLGLLRFGLFFGLGAYSYWLWAQRRALLLKVTELEERWARRSVGHVDKVEEDDRGLKITARIYDFDTQTRLSKGFLEGLSLNPNRNTLAVVDTKPVYECYGCGKLIEREGDDWVHTFNGTKTCYIEGAYTPNVMPIHKCWCHSRTNGPCLACRSLGCQVWDFNAHSWRTESND